MRSNYEGDSVGGEVQQRCFGVLKPGGVLPVRGIGGRRMGLATTQPPSQEQAANHQISASMLI
jgi:hypothetical protein